MQYVLRLSWLRCTQMHESHDKCNTAHVRFVLMIVWKHCPKNRVMYSVAGRVWSQVGVLHVPCHSWRCRAEREKEGEVRERENCSIGKYIDDALHNKIGKTVSLCKPACHYTDKEGNSLSIACQQQNACHPAQIVLSDMYALLMYSTKTENKLLPGYDLTATSGLLPFNPTLPWSHAIWIHSAEIIEQNHQLNNINKNVEGEDYIDIFMCCNWLPFSMYFFFYFFSTILQFSLVIEW